jgi:hypothetical protein
MTHDDYFTLVAAEHDYRIRYGGDSLSPVHEEEDD